MSIVFPVLIAGLAALLIAAQFVPLLDKWPEALVIPVRGWVTDFFAWFAQMAKPVTRAIAWCQAQPLA